MLPSGLSEGVMARTWAEIERLGLSKAERKLVEKCKAGKECVLGDGERPEGPSQTRTIRAEVLRYLILGGCEDCRVHEQGVRLKGAFVVNTLDISFLIAKGNTQLRNCTFKEKILAKHTVFKSLAMEGSKINGLNAPRSEVFGSLHLREGFETVSRIVISGSRIGGSFSLRESKLAAEEVDVIYAPRIRVSGALFIQSVKINSGRIDLSSAQVGDLVDDVDSWPQNGRIRLNGFAYDKIGGEFTDVRSRLDWLSRGTVWNGEFHPQPYIHLAKVYRNMGHERAARVVSIKRIQLTQWHDWQRAHRALNGDWGPAWRSVVADWVHAFGVLSRIVVGYGYAPFRSLWSLLILWFAASWLALAAWHEGSMVPNSPVILTSADWQAYETRPHAGEEWSVSTAPGRDWETFHPLAWGADLVMPILDLGQTQAWAPSTARGRVGWHLWWAQWFLEAAGWIVAALFAAAVTGIIRKDDD